ncbi:MAG: signal peptide peptidase SppA, partial [Nocardioidaceae bacterium]
RGRPYGGGMRPTDLDLAQRVRPALLLELDLTQGVRETPPASPVEAARFRHVPVLRAVVEALREASYDERVVGLVAHVGSHPLTLAQAEEVRAAVSAFGQTGKPAVCWSESFGELGPGTLPYYVASAFNELWLQPSGDVGLTGVVAQAVFVRDALDKLGVTTQVGQRREYKTAANMFVESGMTAPHREMVERLVESASTTIIDGVAAGRGLTADAVQDARDHAPLAADEALERGLVDRLGYRDEVYADLRERLGPVQLRYVTRYGKGLGSVNQQAARVASTVTRRPKPVVAVVQASGGIHLGRSRQSPLGASSVGADSLGAALRAVGQDDSVHAVVLRVDSPGGSYVASDAVRREVLRLRLTGRPVVASMASVAGSGGYYIAMPADVIVASSGTLTGSIGVLAGKEMLRSALSRIGVQRESVSSGKYAEMFSRQRPFTDDEWQRMEAWLDRVYADFTTKAADDRGMAVADLEAVARGRVWSGADAREHGLVDEVGGLDQAVEIACSRAALPRSGVVVKTLPKASLVERLRPAESSEHHAAATLGLGAGTLGLGAGTLGFGAGTLGRGAGFETALGDLGLAPLGVLTMPVTWHLS